MYIKQTLLIVSCVLIGFNTYKANLDSATWFAAAMVISALGESK